MLTNKIAYCSTYFRIRSAHTLEAAIELSDDNKERLKKVAIYAIPAVLGAVAVKNERIQNAVKHTSYWENSKTFILDFIPDGLKGSIRLSGTVKHGPGGREDIEDVLLHEGFEYPPEAIDTLESVFPIVLKDDPLQNG